MEGNGHEPSYNPENFGHDIHILQSSLPLFQPGFRTQIVKACSVSVEHAPPIAFLSTQSSQHYAKGTTLLSSMLRILQFLIYLFLILNQIKHYAMKAHGE
jgi:hypothetical protein